MTETHNSLHGSGGAGGVVAVGERQSSERQSSEVGRVLAGAFRDEPVTAWLIPDPDERAELLPVFFSWLTVEVFLNHGRVDLLTTDTTADTTTDGDLVAVALWLDRTREAGRPVGSGADPAGPLRGLGADPDRVAALTTALGAAHPTDQHEYLMFAGVLPEYQGRGLGSRLLRRHHERQDACGHGAYLEATSPASRALYTRHGYRDHGQPIHLPDGPLVWPMWRAPQTPRRQPSRTPMTEITTPGTGPAGGGACGEVPDGGGTEGGRSWPNCRHR